MYDPFLYNCQIFVDDVLEVLHHHELEMQRIPSSALFFPVSGHCRLVIALLLSIFLPRELFRRGSGLQFSAATLRTVSFVMCICLLCDLYVAGFCASAFVSFLWLLLYIGLVRRYSSITQFHLPELSCAYALAIAGCLLCPMSTAFWLTSAVFDPIPALPRYTFAPLWVITLYILAVHRRGANVLGVVLACLFLPSVIPLLVDRPGIELELVVCFCFSIMLSLRRAIPLYQAMIYYALGYYIVLRIGDPFGFA